MSSLLSNDYAVVFGALRSLGYLSVDLSVVLDGLRGGMLSSDVLSRVFVVSATPADVKVVKPKRTVTPSAYACFLTAKRVDIKAMLKQETPEISAKDLNMSVMRKAGEIWKAMSDDDKRVYVEQSSALKSSPVVAEEAKPKKESKQKEAKPKKESKPKTKKEAKPKKESKPSAYMCFLAAKRVEIRMLLKQETPEISAKELNLSVMRKAGEIWKAMSEDEKRIYVDQSSSLKSSVGSVVVIAEEAKPQSEEVKPCVEEVKEEVKAEVVEEVEEEAEETDEEAEAEAEDEDVLVYNATFNVWVHDVSGMYYAENDIDGEPLGQLKNGKLVPFKKSSSKKSVAK